MLSFNHQDNPYIYKAYVEEVIDGDTYRCIVDLGFKVSVRQTLRLYGADAYEISLRNGTTEDEKKKGIHAKYYLKELIENKNVEIETIKDKQGKYGRFLVNMSINNQDIKTLLSDKGFLKHNG